MPLYELLFTRDLINGVYDIDNPLRLDESGNQIHLFCEIQDGFPGWEFSINMDGTQCTLQAPTACTDEPALLIIISDHKNNT